MSTAAIIGGVVAVSAVVLGWALAALPSRGETGHGSVFEGIVRGRHAPVPAPPDSLEELDRLVRWRLSTAGDVHLRLRPVVREIAAHRLRRGHAVDLDRSPEAARRLLGEAAFELVRPDRPTPPDRLAPTGVTPDELAGIVERLEAL